MKERISVTLDKEIIRVLNSLVRTGSTETEAVLWKWR